MAGGVCKDRRPHTRCLPSPCRPLRSGNGCSVHVDGPSCSMTSKPWKGPSLDPDPLQIQKQEAGLGQDWSRSHQGSPAPRAPLPPCPFGSFWIRSTAEPVDRDTWCEPLIAVLPKSCD